MTKKIPVTGFDPEKYVGFRIMEIPISMIYVPHLVTGMGLGYRSPQRTRRYARMLKAGEMPPPIELVKTVSVDGRPLKKPFTISNGEHRYGAAVLAGCQTIRAVIALIEEDDEFNEEDYATSEAEEDYEEPKAEMKFRVPLDEDDEEFLLPEPSDEEFLAVRADDEEESEDTDA